MKKNYLLVFTAMLLLLSFSVAAQPWMQSSILNANPDPKDGKSNFLDIQKAFNDYWKDKTPPEEESESGEDWGYQQFKRWESFMEPRTYPTGEFFDPEILYKEYQNQKNVQHRLSIHPVVTSANWTEIGPTVIPTSGGGNGRINTVRIDPIDTNIVYACSANGGLWKSTIGGGNWSTFTDLLPGMGIADIAINPRYHDSIFVATGDRDGYIGSSTRFIGMYSAGVMVSGDGGQTWNTTGLGFVQTQSKVIYRMLIHPANPDVLLASSTSGVYRSSNAGATWTLVRSGDINDMEFKADDPNTIYACTSTNLYKSIDAGVNWSLISSALGGGGGAVIAVTAADPLVIYSLNGSLICKKSIDGGQTFTTTTSFSTLVGNQGFLNCALAVSPTNANFVFCGAQATIGIQNLGGIVKSTNGGSTWATIASNVHCDHHDIVFSPGSGTTIYNTNDGGIYKSTNAGTTWTNISSGIGIKQYYRLGASALTANHFYAGAQDNGTDQLKSGIWKRVTGGDGMDCLIDYTNDNVAYASSQYGNFYKTTNGNSFTQMTSIPGSGTWTSPMVMDPINHNTLYLGLASLYKSTNAGSSWTAIGSGFGGNIRNIAVAPSDANCIYVGVLSKLSRTSDGGATWVNISAGLPLSTVGLFWVTVSSLDPQKVWVTLTGYSAGNKVYASTNGGTTWTNVSGSLPNVPVNCITYQVNSQDALYVGTDLGVYYKDATMNDWIPFNTGLPSILVYELEIQYGNINKIRAATFGRGLWESDLNSSSSFSLDAGMMNIISPTTLPLCDTSFSPQVTIRNFGSATITSLNINYQVDAGAVQVYTWSGSLASFASTTITLPSISAATGTHSLTIFTSDPNASPDENSFNDIRTSTFTINDVELPTPVTEGFETATFPPVTWELNDPNAYILRFTTSGGFGNSNSSLKARCYTATNSYAYLKSSQIDFSNLIPPASLTFSLAYAMKSSTSHDSLKVLVSTDCGLSFTQVYSKTATALATVPIRSTNYTPVSSDWRTERIDLSPYIGQSHVQIQFVFYGDGGNNIYVDDINVFDATTTVQEQSNVSLASVFPNPTNGEVTFNFNSPPNEKVVIELYDLIGNKITEMNVARTRNNIVVDLGKRASGVYFYRISNGNNSVGQGKIVKL